MIGLLGRKLGMTHVYDEFGRRRAVTAIEAGPCTILAKRERERDGYDALQLGFLSVKDQSLTKPLVGQFKKTGGGSFRYVKEFRLPARPETSGGEKIQKTTKKTGSDADTPSGEEAGQSEWKVGQQLTIDIFKEYELVDVTGISIGKGFQGGMKRWHWSGGGETHGSMSHRAPGSIGSTTTPGRVWRGHHLPGHMGHRRVTIENLRIARLDAEHRLLLVEGAVPGGEGGLLFISKSQKRPDTIKKPQAFQAIIEEEEETSKKAKAKK